VTGSKNRAITSLHFLLAAAVLAILAIASWLDIYPAVARQLEIGSFVPVWLVASIVGASPILAVAVLAALDKHFHAREGQQLRFGQALLKICLAFSPVTLGVVIALLAPNADVHLSYFDPFNFFTHMLTAVGPTVNFFAHPGWWLWVALYGLPWLASCATYAKLSRLSRRRLAIALFLTPLIVNVIAFAELPLIIGWID